MINSILRKEETIFICQILESNLKVIKCIIRKGSKREFAGLEVENALAGLDEKKVAEKIKQLLNKLGFNQNQIIIALPRHMATLRYLKVPSLFPEEIERIINLQAAHYLPYPPQELITSYQVISTDKDGYSNVNIVIVHKSLIERYINIFKELKPKSIKIILSSFGLCNLYHYIKPEDKAPVMLVDIDVRQIELAISSKGKLLFSRSFRRELSCTDWERIFVDELNKTRDAYSKDVSKEDLSKIIIFAQKNIPDNFIENITKRTNIPTEVAPYIGNINLMEKLRENAMGQESSLACGFGMGVVDIPDSLNLMPQAIRELSKQSSQQKDLMKLSVFILATILMFWGAQAKHMENKTQYLKRLKQELGKLEQESRPLEEIDRKFKLLQGLSQKRLSSIEVLYEIYQVIPEQIYLNNLIYEEDNQIVLRGQTPELNSVFAFVSKLENSKVFKDLNIKIRYATKKQTQAGEIAEFEIICARK